MKQLSLVIALSLCYLNINAQSCDLLYDNFANSAAWTQVGTNVLVLNNEIVFENNAEDQIQRRVYRSLGSTLNSNDTWSIEVDFYVENTPTGSVGHIPAALTSGTQEFFSNCPDVACTGYPPGIQDGIGVCFLTSNGFSTDRAFYIRAIEGYGSLEYASLPIPALNTNTTYYLKLERVSPIEVKLAVYSDSQRTVHLAGSPVSLIIPGSISDLSTVQVGNIARGFYTRQMNGRLENDLCISSQTSLGCNNCLPCPNSNIVHVDQNASGLDNGTSWLNAYNSLQDALDKADACPMVSEIWVAEGTYLPEKYPSGCVGCTSNRDFTFYIKPGLKLYGGFAGDETILSERNSLENITIISGDFNDDDITSGIGNLFNISNNSENAHHVILSVGQNSSQTIIDGFTILGGNSEINSGIHVAGIFIERRRGGGVYFSGGNVSLNNNIIKNNSCLNTGGGVYLNGQNFNIAYNTITKNESSEFGSGIYNCSSNTNITGNTIFLNSTSAGGGIYSANGPVLYSNNLINYNYASNIAGGLCLNGSSNDLINNTIYGNVSEGYGGGLVVVNSNNNLINNIFWENKINGTNNNVQGSDFYNITSSINVAKNNVLQLNQASYNGNFAFNIAQDNVYTQDPMFLNPQLIAGIDENHRTEDDGFRLRTTSPALGAGFISGSLPGIDITGLTRNAPFDLGCYSGSINPMIVIQTQAMDSQNNCDQNADIQSWLQNHGGAVAFSNAGLPITWSNDFENSHIVYACPESYEVEVTFTATDADGNSISTSAVFSSTDSNGPIVVSPGLLNLDCSNEPELSLTNWLNTGPNVLYDCGNNFVKSYAPDIQSLKNDLDLNSIAWVIFTVTDECGNSTVATGEVSIGQSAPNTYFQDNDGDGFGDNNHSIISCFAQAGYVDVIGDCDDADANVNPASTEVCDCMDNDCDAQVNEGLSCSPPEAKCYAVGIITVDPSMLVYNGPGTADVFNVPVDLFDNGSTTGSCFEDKLVKRLNTVVNFNWTTNGSCIDAIPNSIYNNNDKGSVLKTCLPVSPADFNLIRKYQLVVSDLVGTSVCTGYYKIIYAPSQAPQFLDMTAQEVTIAGLNEDMLLFPNPGMEELNILVEWHPEYANSLFVKILDSNGRLVYFNNDLNTGHLSIPVSDWVQGIYQVTLGGGERTSTRKWIKI